jgi:hypothetical protein
MSYLCPPAFGTLLMSYQCLHDGSSVIELPVSAHIRSSVNELPMSARWELCS